MLTSLLGFEEMWWGGSPPHKNLIDNGAEPAPHLLDA
jgi:hypothetical protein